MRSIWFVLLLGCLIACGAPSPESEEAAESHGEAVETGVMETEGTEADEAEDEEEIETPPAGALPKSEILANLEAQGFTQIIETEFEDGVWEVEYVADGEEHELLVDPMTGEILPEEEEEEEGEES